MNKMSNIAYKYRIYPNKQQKTMLQKTFGCTRHVYNTYLAMRKDSYEQDGISVSYKDTALALTKQKEKETFLKEVDSVALQQALRQLDDAFQRFFKHQAHYPHFKSKKNMKHSYSTVNINNNIRMDGNYIKLPKVGYVKVKKHRDIPDGYKLKSATVSQSPSGKYFVSVLFEYENQVEECTDMNKAIGLDFSMHAFYVASDGTRADMPRYFDATRQKLAMENEKLSRLYVKGAPMQSHNYYKQKLKVAKLYEKVANQRQDFLHKLSRNLIQDYDYICIEDLSIKEMMTGMDETHFNRKITDYGWHMFTTMLLYKAKMYGKHIMKVDKYFPSSQTCSCCDSVNPAIKDLSIREWDCPECGHHHDRDINAAINIKKEGLRLAF